jgi:succinate-acetate transporter protein
MMKRMVKFIGGFVFGSCALFVLVYLVGLLLSAVGIVLFDSESDQQRNFNIVLVLWLVVALVSGWGATRIGNKGKE